MKTNQIWVDITSPISCLVYILLDLESEQIALDNYFLIPYHVLYFCSGVEHRYYYNIHLD